MCKEITVGNIRIPMLKEYTNIWLNNVTLCMQIAAAPKEHRLVPNWVTIFTNAVIEKQFPART